MAVRAEAKDLPQPIGSLVTGLAALAAGNVATARTELIHAAERHDAPRAIVVIASLGAGICGALMGQPHAALEIEGAVAAAESAGIEWLARLGRAALALTGKSDSVREAAVVAAASRTIGDEWGAVLARLCHAWGALGDEQDAGVLDELVVGARSLGAPVLEAWTHSIVALAAVRAGEPEATTTHLLPRPSRGLLASPARASSPIWQCPRPRRIRLKRVSSAPKQLPCARNGPAGAGRRSL